MLRLFCLQITFAIMHFWEGHMKISIQLLLLLLLFGSHSLFAAGDAEAGKAKSAPCAACHGVDGNSANPAWPKLAGQGAPYIVEQLKFFKNGTRSNPLMNSQAEALSDQDMQDLAAFYAGQTTTPAAADPELVELGEAIYRGGIIDKDVTACAACHGPSGAGNIPAKFPKLSGQHAAYTESRLEAYRAIDPTMEKTYPAASIMVSVTERLTDHEIDALAQYIQGLHD